MEKNWLVCKKNKILGPFSEDQIHKMLEDEDLALQDEVSLPSKKWVYLKNTFFNPLYESISYQGKSLEEDSSSKNIHDTTVVNLRSISSAEKSDSSDKTKEFKTQQVEGLELENVSQIKNVKKDIQVDDAISVVFSTQDDESVKEKTSQAQFGSIEQINRTVDSQSVKFVRLAWSAIGSGFVIALCVYLWNSIVLEQTRQQQRSQNTLHEARESFSRGDYERSLNLFKQVPVTQSQDKLSFSSLILQMEEDSYRAQVNLENIANDDELDTESKIRELVLQGMIEFRNGNYQLAQEYFQKTKNISSSQIATINSVILSIQTGKKEEALDTLNRVSLSKTNKNFTLFLKSYLSINSKDAGVDAALNTVIQSRGDYAQESSLLSLYRDVVVKKKTNVVPKVQSLLDQDPYLTQEHFYDILSYNPQRVWKDLLLNLCNEVVQASGGQAIFKALQSFCLAQSNLWNQAQAQIEKALSQSPKDSLIQAVYGYILLQNNQEELSQVPIAQSVKNNINNQYIVPFILKARWCERSSEQLDCAEEYWTKVNKNKKYSLSSLGGLVRVYSRMGEEEKSLDFLNQGLKIAPHYKTFISHTKL